MKITFSTLALLALVATSANAFYGKTLRRFETGNPEEFRRLGKHSIDDGRVLNGTGAGGKKKKGKKKKKKGYKKTKSDGADEAEVATAASSPASSTANDYSAAVCMVSYFYQPDHLMADHNKKYSVMMTCDAFANHQGITNTPNCDGTNEDGQNIGDHVRYMGVNGCCGDSGGDAKMRARKTACARGGGDTTNPNGDERTRAGRAGGGCSGHGNCREECKDADDIVSKDVNDSNRASRWTDGIHISQCIHVDYSSDPWRKDATKWSYKKSTGSCLVCYDALKIKFGTKCDNRNGDCKYCDGMIKAYKSCEIISTCKFAVAHTIAFEGISAIEFMADSKIILSFQNTLATMLNVAIDKIFNINAVSKQERSKRRKAGRDKAISTRRQLSGRGLAAAAACRYEEQAAGYFLIESFGSFLFVLF